MVINKLIIWTIQTRRNERLKKGQTQQKVVSGYSSKKKKKLYLVTLYTRFLLFFNLVGNYVWIYNRGIK